MYNYLITNDRAKNKEPLIYKGLEGNFLLRGYKKEETRQDLEKMRDGFLKKLTNQKTILLITFYSAITAVQILIILVIINIIVVIII